MIKVLIVAVVNKGTPSHIDTLNPIMKKTNDGLQVKNVNDDDDYRDEKLKFGCLSIAGP